MIIKKMKGSGFKGVASYCLNDKKDEDFKDRAEIIGGNMAGTTPQEISKEFGQLRGLKPQIKNPVRHFAIRLHPKDKAQTNEEWNKLGNEFTEKMGFGNTYKLFVLHKDTQPPHLHIITSQISFEGKLTKEFQDIPKLKTFCREKEIELGLKKISSKPTGNSKLYHPRQRGNCKIDKPVFKLSPQAQAVKEKIQARASQMAPKPVSQAGSVLAPTQQKNPAQAKAQALIGSVVAQATATGGSRYMQLLVVEGSLFGQLQKLKQQLGFCTPEQKLDIYRQISELEIQIANNLSEKLQAWSNEAKAEEAQKQQQKRSLKL